MKVIFFAGGYGKRLWPMSRASKPKQFQKFFEDKTSLESTVYDLKDKFEWEDIFISTNINFVNDIAELLPELPKENIIAEPNVRDTGPAIALAMLILSKKFPNEPVLIRWQNSIIKNPSEFIEALNSGEDLVLENKAEFVYLSVPAKFPNTNVGYIKFKNDEIADVVNIQENKFVFEFEGFTEKPNLETAQNFINENKYGWNPGCYITTPKFVLDNLEKYNKDFSSELEKISEKLDKKEDVSEIYNKLEKISIDYLLWEKLDKNGIKVVLADYDWHYISTWADIYEATDKDNESNIIKGNVQDLGSKNSIIYNTEGKKLVSTINLENTIIINTQDILLVLKKEDSAKIKDYLKNLEEKGFSHYL